MLSRISKYKNLFPWISLGLILTGYISSVCMGYWTSPTAPDSLFYISKGLGIENAKMVNFVDRFYHIYLTHIFSSFFDHTQLSYGIYSFLIHIGTVYLAFDITRHLSSFANGLMAALFVSLLPQFHFLAMEVLVDGPSIFYSLLAYRFSFVNKKMGYLSSGFFLVVALFTKIFAIGFVIPIMVNIFISGRWRGIANFILGCFLSLLCLSCLNYYFLDNFWHHLNPKTYSDYLEGIANLMKTTNTGVSRANIIQVLIKRMPYPFIAIFFLGSCFSVYKNFNKSSMFDWKFIGRSGLILSGILLTLMFIKNSITSPSWYINDNYLYCIMVPWTMAFFSWQTEKMSLKNNGVLILGVVFFFSMLLLPKIFQEYFDIFSPFKLAKEISIIIFVLLLFWGRKILLRIDNGWHKKDYIKLSIVAFLSIYLMNYWSERYFYNFTLGKIDQKKNYIILNDIKKIAKDHEIVTLGFSGHAYRNLRFYLKIESLKDYQFAKHIDYENFYTNKPLKLESNAKRIMIFTQADKELLKGLAQMNNVKKITLKKRYVNNLNAYEFIR